MKVMGLGACQEIGRSCIMVELNNYKIMFDCGVNPNAEDKNILPKFELISENKRFNESVDFIFITHVHNDHCGSLIYFTEVLGYDGPIYMTHESRILIKPILMESISSLYAWIQSMRNLEEIVDSCIKKIICIDYNQKINIKEDLILKTFSAGHVIGAIMVLLESKNESVLYTGDFNTLNDRSIHEMECRACKPDLMICESTHALFIKEPKKVMEYNLINEIYDTLENDGHVLIPISAMGRVLEFFSMLQEFFDKMNLKYKTYFSRGLLEQVLEICSLCNNYVNHNYLENAMVWPYSTENGSWKQIKLEPCVLFATRADLLTGVSLEVFKEWSQEDNNTIILQQNIFKKDFFDNLKQNKKRVKLADGTILKKIKSKIVELGNYSGHADVKGILQVIDICQPRNVMLVHGQLNGMKFLSERINLTYNITAYYPKIGELVEVKPYYIPLNVSENIINQINSKNKIDGYLFMTSNLENEDISLIGKEDGKQLNLVYKNVKFNIKKK